VTSRAHSGELQPRSRGDGALSLGWIGSRGPLSAQSLPLGLLAMAPLLAVYELALLAVGSSARNTSELVLFRLFAPLGDAADLARWLALGALMVTSLGYCLRRQWELGPRLLRIAAEGALGAVVLGPALLAILALVGGGLAPPPIAPGEGGPHGSAPDLARAAFVFGAGAYEELVFRVGIYSALFLVARRVTVFFGAGDVPSRAAGDVAGLVGSALLFSAFHLAVFVSWLGPGGEAFEASLFIYRALAGILLGIVFRWRGPGVAAWTHGFYNLALLLGAGPHVFL